jgi:gluconolactonase
MKIRPVLWNTPTVSLIVGFLLTDCSQSGPVWRDINAQLIGEHSLTVRELPTLPNNNVAPNLDGGKVEDVDQLDSVELHRGIIAKFFWGSGAMGGVLRLEPGAVMPEETLPSDQFVFVLDGKIDQSIDGSMATLLSRPREEPDGTHSGTPSVEFVYLKKGMKRSVVAGEDGAKLLEVYSPLRLDYLQKVGVEDLPGEIPDIQVAQTPNVVPNQVYDLLDFQLTSLAPGAFARIITGTNMQLSFASLDPGSQFPHHIHPEEQISLVLRGDSEEIILDRSEPMNEGSITRIPSNMVHGARVGALGTDVLDLFWPARSDYADKMKTATAAYHAIIPDDARLELLVDGARTKPTLTFSEGPKWMNGKVYFSNMYFDQNFGADPKKSSTVELDPDGSYRNITAGKMQTNGLYPYKNGHLLVCDMMGHRIVEMTTKGEVVRVVVDKYKGKPIDGPNDIITDANGGIYFTDPQFTMEPEKFQPGRAVYYVSAGGEVRRIVEPNEFAMPNGILLSPDGKTLFINNCYDDESWFPVNSEKENYVWAYDVNADGTISNGRPFAKLFLPENVLDRKAKSSSADGMAIDKMGNIYVCTYMGVQIFDAQGKYIGMINLPSFPVSLCFGDEDMKTLYMVSYSKVYKIRTNMEGFVQYL